MDYYFFWWIVLVVFGVWTSFVVFFWAFRAGQFSDQDRARYIPLRDQRPGGLPDAPSRPGAEFLFLILLAVLFLGAMAVMLLLAVGPAEGI